MTDHPFPHDRYTRSNGYDPDWVIENQMGPNALWLLESLIEVLPIEPGTRVLDLGCGKAMTSIFLARELGARVVAADLWIPASENQQRIVEAGVDDLVTPIQAEAHTLPLAADSFDVIVSLDAYQYFGTDDLYLSYLLGFLRAGGRFGAVMPALLTELETVGSDPKPPAHLEPWWESEFCCFHGPDWWQQHWAKTGLVTVDHADAIDDGWLDWHRFNDATLPHATGWRAESGQAEKAMLEADRGQALGFTRIVATRR